MVVTMCYNDKKKTRMSIEDYLSIGMDLLMRNFKKIIGCHEARNNVSMSRFYQQPRLYILRCTIYIAIILQRFFGSSYITEIMALCARNSHGFNAKPITTADVYRSWRRGKQIDIPI